MIIDLMRQLNILLSPLALITSLATIVCVYRSLVDEANTPHKNIGRYFSLVTTTFVVSASLTLLVNLGVQTVWIYSMELSIIRSLFQTVLIITNSLMLLYIYRQLNK